MVIWVLFVLMSILVAAGVVMWARIAKVSAIVLAEFEARAARDRQQIELLDQILAVDKQRRATAERTEAHLLRLTGEEDEDPEAGTATEAFVWKDRQQ